MNADFRREYLVRLPLPLAQAYSRAHNAKDPRGRHDNAFYLFEALVKLAAAPAISAYLAEAAAGAARVPALDRLLAHLALPSLGQWLQMLRELSRHFAGRVDAAAHPLGHLAAQLDAKRRDLPGVLALFNRIKNGPDGEPGADRTCSLAQLFDALVQYRNGVFGHGAGRFESFYEQQMGPLLFPAANEALAEGVLDFLGPRGSRLVYLTELRVVTEDCVEVGLRELVGLQGERLAPLALPAAQAAGLEPSRVAVLWPGRAAPLRLDPLLLRRESDVAEEVLFLNRDRKGKQVEYLSYLTGRTERDREVAPALAALLSRVVGRPVDEGELQALAEQSQAETPSVEALLAPRMPAGAVLGDYELLAELGRGAQGVVYLARQTSLGRLVALKTLPADLAGDETALARFRREIRLLARCDHPHVVKVLSSGALPDGRLYFTMEYVPGCDLEQFRRELAGVERSTGDGASRLDDSAWRRAVLSASRKQREKAAARHSDPTRGPNTLEDGTDTPRRELPSAGPELPLPSSSPSLPPLPEQPEAKGDPGGYVRWVAGHVRDVAGALQAMHEQGLIHRDVKPANLLLTPDGSRVVLMDFGLVKGQTEGGGGLSKGAGFLGTLRYAAPEQLASATLPVGPAADVRALGSVLWELLARRRLFDDAADEAQLAARVHDEELPLLRKADPSLDRDLEAIVARAAARSAAARLASAGLLAQYLQMYLDGQTLPIRVPGLRELAWRWVRRNKPLVALAGAVLAAVVLSAVLVVTQLGERRALARGVAADLEETARLRDRGRYPEAREVLQRARSRLERGGPEELKRQVDRANREVETAARLEEVPLLGMQFIVQTTGVQQPVDLPMLNREGLNGEGISRGYRQAFQEYGIDVDALPADEAAVRVRSSAIRQQLLMALNHWATQVDDGERDRLLAMTETADDDPVRAKVLAAVRRKDRAALEELVGELDVGSLPAASVHAIGMALKGLGAEQRSEQFIRQGLRAHPSNFLLLVVLGGRPVVGTKAGQGDDRSRFLQAATAVRPESSLAHFTLGCVLIGEGQRDAEAEDAFRTAQRLQPADPFPTALLGVLLAKQGKRKEAEALFREGLVRRPGDLSMRFIYGTILLASNSPKEAEEVLSAWVEANEEERRAQKGAFSWIRVSLAGCFMVQKKWDKVEAEVREAMRLRPDEPKMHYFLGGSLAQQKKWEEAEASYRAGLALKPNRSDERSFVTGLTLVLFQRGKVEEIERLLRQDVRDHPDDPEARYALSTVLLIRKKFSEVEAELRQAVRLRRDYAEAHARLGALLENLRRPTEAETHYREWVRVRPGDVNAHLSLSKLLFDQQRYAEAEAAARLGVRQHPNQPSVRRNLGLSLARQGKLAAAVEELQRYLNALPASDPQRQQFGQSFQYYRRLLQRERQLPGALMSGRKRTAAESVDYAVLCLPPYRRLYHTAAGLYTEAFEAMPSVADDLGQGHRYNAACAAALAGCGQGEEAVQPDDGERARLRKQALTWLRADLDAWEQRAGGGAENRRQLLAQLAHWKRDADLAGVREAKALEGLPEMEQEQWRRLWADVDALARRFEEGGR